MNWNKYIIVDFMNCELAITFDSIIPHSDFLECFRKPNIISAGFFDVSADKDNISVSCFGESTTLKLKSRKEDARLVKKLLTGQFGD